MQRYFSRSSVVRFMWSIVVSGLVAPGVAAHAQQKVPPNPVRITQVPDDSLVTTLKGNVRPLARAQNDLGPVPVSQPMNHVQLVLQRSSAQEAALEEYLANVQIKSSPSYHKWLTPQQFGSLYGPNDADITAITSWLTTHGFTVNQVANGRTFIDFSGSAAQIQSAFHTSIHSYEASGLRFYANANDPSIPTAFASVVSGITHLNNIPLKPLHVAAGPAKFDSQAHRFVPLTSKVRGQYTINGGSGQYSLAMVPADAATVYDTPNSTLNGKFKASTSYTGAGVTIGIMGQSSIDPTLVQNYRNLFVGDTKAPIISNLDGVGDVSGDDNESYIDNELAGGLAPGATIHFYTASATTDNGVITAAQYAVDIDDTIDVLSMSYGSCELGNTTSGNQEINSLWQQAAAQGITVIVSTGDTGSADCDTNDAMGTTAAMYPQSVNALASTQYDIAVGGTDFDALINSNGSFNTQYVSTSTGSASTYYRTALGYIPEATWNDSTLNNTTITDNVPLTAGGYSADISAGGGGPSNCSTNTTTDSTTGSCTAGYPKPSWQNPGTISGMPNDQARDVPDVSLLSGTGFYGAFWAVCDGSANGFDANNNPGTANCVANSSGDFYTDGFGGTSTAAPAFAGMMAMIVQKTGQRQGQAAPILYSLYTSTPSIFHDVNLGNNSVPCSPSTYNTNTCVTNTQGYDFMTGYNSNAGYDLATGLGSVDANLLVNAWTSAAGSLDVANVAATASATTIASNQPLTFTVNVTPLASSGSTPAGSVVVTDSVSSYKSSPVALTNGSATVTVPANSLQASTADVFTIGYVPPSTGAVFAPASDFVTVAITQAATPSLTLSGPSISTTPGGAGTSAITVTPGGGFTGAVALTCAVTGPAGATSIPTCSLNPASVTVSGTTAQTSSLSIATTATTTLGSYTATVTATGTGNVVGSAPIVVTVASTTTPTLSVSGAPVSIVLPATTGSSAITVTPGGGFTGAVNLTCTVTAPSGAVSAPTCAFSTTSVTINGPAAVPSTLNITAYPTTSAGTYSVNVTAAATGGTPTSSVVVPLTVSGTPASETITLGTPTAGTVPSPGQSGTSMFSVTTNYAPATINFGCTLATSPSGANASYNPGCNVAPVTVSTSGKAGTATATFTTTASNSGALTYPLPNRKQNRWYTATGGAALACILFFGIPARRRGWKSMLSLLVFLAATTGFGCGGGSNNNNNVPTGTSTGTYTFTVIGIDSVTSTIMTTPTTVTLTVN